LDVNHLHNNDVEQTVFVGYVAGESFIYSENKFWYSTEYIHVQNSVSSWK